MLDLFINIQNSSILSLINQELYEQALIEIDEKLSISDLLLDNEAHLLLLKAVCNSSLHRYPLAIHALNKILKYRYTLQIENHILSQAFFLKAKFMMDHSIGKNQKKNGTTFLAISDCLNLLNYRSETLALMDDFLKLVGEK